MPADNYGAGSVPSPIRVGAATYIVDPAMTALAHRREDRRGDAAVWTSTRARIGSAAALTAIGLGLAVVALLGPLASGAIALNGDPNASTGNAVFMTVLGLAFVALAVALVAPLFARQGTHRA